MKKILILVFTFVLVMNVSSQKDNFSRWSVTAEYGFGKFDGDINQDLTSILPASFNDASMGLTTEYSLTPVWGVSLDLYRFSLRASNKTTLPLFMRTELYNTDINATINVTQWIFPHSKSKFSVNASLGFGLAAYFFDVRRQNADGTMGTPFAVTEKTPNGNTIILSSNGKAVNPGIAGSIPIIFSLEYNLSKPIAIGGRVHYRTFTKDDLEGVTFLNYKGNSNDGIASGTLYLRFKFDAGKKKHMKNMSMDYYDPDQGLIYAKVLRQDFNGLKEKVDSLTKRVDNLENDLSIARAQNSSEVSVLAQKGGIANQRNLPNEIKPDSFLVLKGQTPRVKTDKSNTSTPSINKLKEIKELSFDTINIKSIYFDSNEFMLDKNAMLTLTDIADKMKRNPELKIKINGFCDDTGDIAYNDRLSRLRADQVKEKLIANWGIESDRIVSVGRGKASSKPGVPYRPNRRCDFYFSK